MLRKTTKDSAVYHIANNIENLQFNISFRYIKSLLNLPKFDVRTGASTLDVDKRENSKCEKVITIKWQEKLFSPQEIAFYRDIRNCTTESQKAYHQNIILRDGDVSMLVSSEPIFTYVDGDNFEPEQDEAMMTANAALTKTDSADVVMYVYAALNPNTMLVSLRWQPSHKMLHIFPDFNSFHKNPFFIEIDTDYRHLYAYAVENISKQSRKWKDCTQFTELQLPEITNWEDIEELSSKFAMPPKRTRRIILLFEIQSGKGFQYGEIHVRYSVQLPDRTIAEEGLLTACTHSSRKNSCGVYSFGHCWEIVILCEEDFEFGNMCHVFFEVISVDNWERERTEGYSHVSFFLDPRYEVSLLQCHRPTDGSIMEKLSRYFIGGRRKFDFRRFYGGDVGFCNRYGTNMVNTGTLTVHCQRISQRNPELLRPASEKMTGMTLDDIMKAYREARRRLEAVVLD